MSSFQPFSPHRGSNQVLTAGASNAVINITPGDMQVRILNTGAAIAYVVTYSSAETAIPASTSQHAVAAGQSSIITTPLTHDRLAYISATGTTLQVSTGEGW